MEYIRQKPPKFSLLSRIIGWPLGECSNPRGRPYYLDRALNGVTEKCKFGTIMLDNIVLIVDNKNVFTYLVWLGIGRVIHQKYQFFRFSVRDWSSFFNFWMQDRAVPNNLYMELIYQKPPNFSFLSRIIDFMVVTGVFFNSWMHKRAVSKNVYVEIIHQNPPNFKVFWSWIQFFSIRECTREQCPKPYT